MNKCLLLILITFLSCKNDNSNLENLIGKDINSKEFQNYLNELKENPEITRFPYNYYYSFNNSGIDFSFTLTDTIETIFLYSEGSDDRRQYKGQLPFDINFSDTRKIVEQKLGPPDENEVNSIMSFKSTWNDKKICVSYKSFDSQDMNIKISHIILIE